MTPAEFRDTLAQYGLTQDQAAIVLGKGLRTVHGYCNGRTPIPLTVERYLVRLSKAEIQRLLSDLDQR